MSTRNLLKWTILVTLLAGGLCYWYVVMPRTVAVQILEKYETACYARDLWGVNKLLYRRIYDRSDQKQARSRFHLFDKFEPGFELISVKRVDWDFGVQMIEVAVSKVAKIDHKKRQFSNIRLINEGGGWKVFQYYFPDLIDY
jgi:hypothetical protein